MREPIKRRILQEDLISRVKGLSLVSRQKEQAGCFSLAVSYVASLGKSGTLDMRQEIINGKNTSHITFLKGWLVALDVFFLAAIRQIHMTTF